MKLLLLKLAQAPKNMLTPRAVRYTFKGAIQGLTAQLRHVRPFCPFPAIIGELPSSVVPVTQCAVERSFWPVTGWGSGQSPGSQEKGEDAFRSVRNCIKGF